MTLTHTHTRSKKEKEKRKKPTKHPKNTAESDTPPTDPTSLGLTPHATRSRIQGFKKKGKKGKEREEKKWMEQEGRGMTAAFQRRKEGKRKEEERGRASHPKPKPMHEHIISNQKKEKKTTANPIQLNALTPPPAKPPPQPRSRTIHSPKMRMPPARSAQTPQSKLHSAQSAFDEFAPTRASCDGVCGCVCDGEGGGEGNGDGSWGAFFVR